MPGVPKYAAHVPPSELVKILCRSGRCPKGQSTYARLQRAPYDAPDPNEKFAGHQAVCLRCGYVASDNYNWTRS
jgi:hypothetical protein